MMKDGLDKLRIDKAIEDQKAQELVRFFRMVHVRNCVLCGVPITRLDRELEEILHGKAD